MNNSNPLPDILRVGKWVKPLPGRGEIVERTNGKVVRLALTCGECHETVYDFLGLEGEKRKPGTKRKLMCPFCVKSYERMKEEYIRQRGWAAFYYKSKLNGPPDPPREQMIPIREE